MSSKKRETVYLRGKIFWAKIFGAPRTNYNEDGREWAFEFEPNENGVDVLDSHGVADRLRDNKDKNGNVKKGYENRKPYLILRRNELDYEGNTNEHIRVVNSENQKWPENTLIGNESVADVKIQIVDYGRGKKKGIYPVAIRVLDLVPYETNDFAPLPEDDEYKGKTSNNHAPDFEKDFGLEEDEPSMPDTDAGDPPAEDELDDDMPAE